MGLLSYKSFHSQRGFSLTEVMIAAGLMGVISVGMMALQKNGSLSQKTLLAQDDARVLTDGIASLMANGTACYNSFGLKTPIAGSTISSGNAIFDKDNAVRFVIGSIYGNRTLKLNSVTIGGSGTDARSGTLKWQSTGTSTGVALVVLEWLQTGAGASTATSQNSGPKSLYRYFQITATLNGSNQIASCSAVSGTTSSSGTGTTNKIPLWTTSSSLGDSVISQSGSSIGINNASPGALLDVDNGTTQCCAPQTPNISLAQASNSNGFYSWLQFHNAGESEAYIRLAGGAASGARSGSRRLEIGDSQSVGTSLTLTGNLGIGTTAPGAPVTINSGSNSQVTAYRAGYAGFRLDSDSAGKFYIYDGAGNAWNQSIISSGSSVGVGKNASSSIPVADLYVNGITRLGTSANADAYVVIFSHAATGRLAMQGENAAKNAKKDIIINPWGGNVGIGAQAPAYLLQVGNSGDGTQARANAWNAFSDRRLKNIQGRITNACEMIDQLNGYYYTWKKGSDRSRQVGVIAQEVEKVLPEIVSNGSDGIKSLDYSKLTAVLIESTKELNHRSLDQDSRIRAQEATLKAQEDQIKAKASKVASMENFLQLLEGFDLKENLKKIEGESNLLSNMIENTKAQLSKLESNGTEKTRDISSLKIESANLKTENDKLEKTNKALKQQNDAIRAYLCAKDAHAPICK